MSILLIHTGGTIGMAATTGGFAPRTGVVEAAVRDLIEAGEVAGPVEISAMDPQIDSADAGPQVWNAITAIIADEYDRHAGFVVTHGSDTLAYSAAACGFALRGLGKPVILTGAMRPLTVEASDGLANLRDALMAAAGAEGGVWVQFAGKRMHGARISKTHPSALDAFSARESLAPPRAEAPRLMRRAIVPARVGVLTVAPAPPGDFFGYAAARLDGIVLRCYGAGTAPNDPDLVAALRTAEDRGVPVLAVTTCSDGALSLRAYAAGAILRDNGVIDGRDMTMEAAYVKMMHVLGEVAEPGERKALLARPICGEISAGS